MQSSIDLTQILEKAEEQRQQEIKKLKSCSKPLHELVVEERFIVDDVIAKSYPTSFAPYSEMIIGGESHIYSGGFTSKLVLKVTPDSKDVPVRTLNFEGFSIVKLGDYISAKIPRYEEKRIKRGIGANHPFMQDLVFYFDREFNATESAIELSIRSKYDEVLRREWAVDYEKFRKG